MKRIKSKIISLAIIGILMFLVPTPSYSFGLGSIKHLKQKTAFVKKSETKQVLKKFLKTMGLVAGSCGVIFAILLVYRRFSSAKIVQVSETKIETNLNSPETVEEATKFVIEKF